MSTVLSWRPKLNQKFRASSHGVNPMSRTTSSRDAPNGGPTDMVSSSNERESLLSHHSDNSTQEKPLLSRISETTWLVLRSNYANVLLVFVPLGIIFGALNKDPVIVFIFNFLAIVPLAALLSFATEELSAKLGQTVGGLMNATFGNAVELIVSIIALRENQIRIVQASMLGSILSNILLVRAGMRLHFTG